MVEYKKWFKKGDYLCYYIQLLLPANIEIIILKNNMKYIYIYIYMKQHIEHLLILFFLSIIWIFLKLDDPLFRNN